MARLTSSDALTSTVTIRIEHIKHMNGDRQKGALALRERSLRLDHTLLMGVVNVTPDSFSDGGLFLDAARAVDHAKRLVDEGAEILDVGAESSRPGSDPVSDDEEWTRLQPVLERLMREVDVPVSVDTYKPQTAEHALSLGAHMINDIGGLRQIEMIEVAARFRAPVVVMHMKGEPKTMQRNVHYEDVVKEVADFLAQQAHRAMAAGVPQVVIDPGIGFGKNTEHNLALLKRLDEIARLPYPLLVGPSRKSFLGRITGAEANDRLEATIAAVTASVLGGADIVRVHDMKECRRAVLVADAIRGA